MSEHTDNIKGLLESATGREVKVFVCGGVPLTTEQYRAMGFTICHNCNEPILVNNWNKRVHSECIAPYIDKLEAEVERLKGYLSPTMDTDWTENEHGPVRRQF
jgi:hypothetical protein